MILNEYRMDKKVKLSLICGGIVAFSGLLGYIVLPLTKSEFTDFARIVVSVMGKSFEYHAIVLTIPSWLVTFGGVIQARRWGLDSRWDDIVIVGGVIGVPMLIAFATYVITAVGMALAIVFGSSVETPLVVIAAIGLIFLALSIGFAFAVIVFGIVLLAVGAGSIIGYTSARAVIYLWRSTSARQ